MEFFTAVGLNNQAQKLVKLGAFDRAEKLHKEALSIKIRTRGENSIQVALTLNALGEVQLKMGKLPEALSNMTKALHIREHEPLQLVIAPPLVYWTIANASFDALTSRENLAQIYEAMGDLLKARSTRIEGKRICGHFHCQKMQIPHLRACGKCKSVWYCS